MSAVGTTHLTVHAVHPDGVNWQSSKDPVPVIPLKTLPLESRKLPGPTLRLYTRAEVSVPVSRVTAIAESSNETCVFLFTSSFILAAASITPFWSLASTVRTPVPSVAASTGSEK